MYLTLGVGAIVVYYRLPKAGVAQGVLLTTLNATAAGTAFRAARAARGSNRVLWTALGVAMALTTLANGPYYGFPLITGRQVPFPCPVDALLLLAFPCFFVALVALARQHRGEIRRGKLLDTAIVVVGGGLLMWELMIAPAASTPGLSTFAHTVAVAYPVSDLVVFALLVRLLMEASVGSASTRWLVASFVALLAGAVKFAIELGAGTYSFGGPTDALWMLSYLLVGVGALHPTAKVTPRKTRPEGHRRSRGRLVVVVGSLLIGPVVLASRPREVVVVTFATVVSFLLAGARLTWLHRAKALRWGLPVVLPAVAHEPE